MGTNVALGEKTAHSKKDTFDNIKRPSTWGYLRIIIGLFGLYRKFPHIRVVNCTLERYNAKATSISEKYQNEDMELMHKIWV